MKEKELRSIKIFKALSNSTRYLIIKLLNKNEYTPNFLADILNKRQSTVSQHLKILKDLDIVSYRTNHKEVYYKLKKKKIINLILNCEELYFRE